MGEYEYWFGGFSWGSLEPTNETLSRCVARGGERAEAARALLAEREKEDETRPTSRPLVRHE